MSNAYLLALLKKLVPMTIEMIDAEVIRHNGHPACEMVVRVRGDIKIRRVPISAYAHPYSVDTVERILNELKSI